MRPFTDLFGASQFSIGFLVGILALAITLPAALGLSALSSDRYRRPGLAGLAFAVASVLALGGTLGTDEIFPIPADLVIALLLLWCAGEIAARTPAPGLIGPIAAFPGAVVLAGANVGLSAGWVSVLIAGGAVLIGATTADFDRRTGRYGLGPLLLFIAVGGIYVTVPDTELMRAVVGVAMPLVFLAWPYAAASLGGGGAYASVGVLLWIMPIEGLGRPGSIVGAVGAFALLVGEPLGRILARELEGRTVLHRFPVRYPRATVVVSQGILVLYATRVAGMAETAFAAFVLLIPAMAAAVAFGVFVAIPERRHRHRTRRAPDGSSSATSRGGSSGRRRRRSNGYGP